MTHLYKVKYVYPEKVLRIYKIMKENPLKAFIPNDFGRGVEISKHLWLLSKLGLIMRVYVKLHRNSNAFSKGYKFVR